MMRHFIIVKFTEGTDVKALVEPVRGIFEKTLEIPGIHSLDIRLSNSDIALSYFDNASPVKTGSFPLIV